MKFGIVFKEGNNKAEDFAKMAGEFLKKNGHRVLTGKDLKGSEIIVTFGGDGTLIHKACEYTPLGVPFVGINIGRLGFLTATEASSWQEALEKLIRGKYFVSNRMTVEARVKGKKNIYRALNEVVVKGLYRIVDFEIKVNDERFLRVLGDGVIVATQTGSTAYSLSSGGPIVGPELNCILLTPINPIGLPVPSVVLSPTDELLVKVVRGDDVSLVIDGQEHTKLSAGQTIKITRGKYNVKFGYFDKNQFLKSLNAKFGLATRLVG